MNHSVRQLWKGIAVAAACALVTAAVLGTVQTKGKKKRPSTAVSSLKKANAKAKSTSVPSDSTGAPHRAIDSVAVRTKPVQQTPFQFRKVTNGAFSVGERLVFDVSYGYITAGEAVMAIPAFEEVMGRKCYHVDFTVNSLPSFSWIFKVEDHYLTCIDAESIAPLKFEQHIREGTYQRDFVAEFDQEHHIARTTEGQYPIPEYVHDIMSAFYYFRTLDFSNSKPGDEFTLFNFYKDTSYELAVRFLGRREQEVAAGTFNTIVVEPLVKEGGLFKSEGRIVIWLSDDDLKIPVRVNTKVVIGSIDTELREYSGLSGELRSRIK